ncbi:putative ribonuclease H-like domain-containing protein, partial [Tanacetum coccineum]
TQEEGIDYVEFFVPIARIEAIRLFLAYALFKDFVVYQMDVKSAFLYGKIKEEVYVCQPPGFEDPDFPDRVYKVEKSLYGLHQALRAWYETLSTYLLDNEFQRGKIDKTLFIKRNKGDILLVQVYVDEIIFGSTKKELLQQKKDGIFISQDKYMEEILKKFGFTDVKTASTPMETQKPVLKDKNGEEMDVHMYRSMIGSLMYLTSSRPDIMFAVCACARYQVNPKVSHLHVVKKIFRYLKGQPKLGLWYPKDSPFDLVAYTDSDYAGASLDRKSTTRGCQFLGYRLISWQCKKQTVVANSTIEAEYVAASSCYLQLEDAEGVDCLPNATIFEQLALMGYEQVSQKLTFYKSFFSPQWKFLIHTVLHCLSPKTTAWNEFRSTMASIIICLATNQKFNFSKFIFESMVKNLDNVGKFFMYPRFVQVFLDKQLEGMSNYNRIYVTPSHTKKIFGNMRRVGKGFSGRQTYIFPTIVVHNQEEMGEGSAIPTNPHHTPTFIQPSPQPQKTQKPRRPKNKDTHVPQSSVPSDNVADEAVYKELDDMFGSGPRRQETMGDTIAQTRVLDLETTKTTQANEIASLKRRVKKLEKKDRSRTHKLKRLYKVGLSARVESSGDEKDLDLFGVHDLIGDEVVVESEVAVKAGEKRNVVEEVFVAEKSGNVVEEVVVVINAASTIPVSTATITDVEITLAQALAELKSAKPKADKIMIQEPEHGTTTTTPTTIIPILKPPQDKDKGIMIEEPVVEQLKPMNRLEQMRLDEELAFKLQAEEEEEERLAREKAQKIEEANVAYDDVQAKSKEENILQLKEHKRRGTDHQQRNIMSMKKVNTFVDYRTELVEESSKKAEMELEENLKKAEAKVMEGSSKRAGEELEQEKEVAIDVVPLDTKPPTIVDWKIHKEGKKSYYHIIRVDGKLQMYRVFSQMLKSFSREDLEDLYKLVKAKYGSTRLVEDLDLILYGDLKTMFKPHVEDQVWKNQDDYNVLDWKLYDSCGVHSLRMQHVYIHMLVEKRYLLKPSTITYMMNKKLQVDYLNEMAYQLLKHLTKQLKNQ